MSVLASVCGFNMLIGDRNCLVGSGASILRRVKAQLAITTFINLAINTI